jgi:hypothetical protein
MKNLFIFSIFLLSSICGYSQTNDTISNPLEKFFQENYDSTIIYYLKSNSEKNEKYYILSRKKDTL